MDAPLPIPPLVEIRSPIVYTPGNIQLKDSRQFLKGVLNKKTDKELDQSFMDMADAIEETEDEIIQGISDRLGGMWSNMSGFGKPVEVLSIPDDAGADSGFGAKLSKLGGTIKQGIGDLKDKVDNSKFNPIDDIALPKIKFQNPINFNLGLGGGQGQLKINNPRELTRTYTRRLMRPGETVKSFGPQPLNQFDMKKDENDRFYEKGGASTPYKDLGSTFYAKPSPKGTNPASDFYPNQSMDQKGGGDRVTLSDMITYSKGVNETRKGRLEELTSEKNGYPVYFKDLRDNTYIFFRGYIDGLQDNHKADWGEETYIGRSEKVYTYKGASRSISFNLSMYAQTAHELDTIYGKLRRLVSLCWPEYKADSNFKRGVDEDDVYNEKMRMKPPLVRLRIGELFGNQSLGGKKTTGSGLLGFLESVNVSWDDKTPWEHRKGKRVPKYVKVNLSFQPTHDSTPDNATQFYGYTGITGNKDLVDNFGAS
jgi:hypothetical protein